MRVSAPRRYLNTLLVESARFLHVTEFFERLPAMEICGGIGRVGGDQLFELRNGLFQLTGAGVCHGQTVAREAVPRILRQHRSQRFHTVHSHFTVLPYPLMPCPWFWPTRPLEEGRWAVPPRVPLIDPWQGECHAGADWAIPDEETVRARCNCGYAAGACSRFVEGRGDAVRFHVLEHSPASFRILYCYERECWPQQRGVIEYDAVDGRAACEDELLGRQVEAFASAYRRRRGAAA